MSLDGLEHRLADYFDSFARGDDVAPATRFYLEGYLQALIDTDALSESEAWQLIATCCQSSLGEEAASVYRNAQGEIVLHSHMRRAPVYPTTPQ